MNKAWLTLCIFLMCFFIEDSDTIVHASELISGKWEKGKYGYIYYNNEGEKISATSKRRYTICEIDGEKYAFNTKGYQVLGWRKIDGDYYYFDQKYGKDGGMIEGKRINGIKIGKEGKAILSSTRAKRKVSVLVRYREWADKILKGKCYVSKKKQLKILYDYLRKLPYRYVGSFRSKDKNWDLWGAEFVYKNKYYDCHPISAAFGYMAGAIGYNDVKICAMKWGGSNYWHGFTLINGRYYDSSLGRVNLKDYSYFNKPLPKEYKNWIKYSKKIKN